MWEKIDLPRYIAERFIGFSLPFNNHVVLIAYDGVYTIDLLSPIKVVIDESLPEGGELYNKQKGILSYDGNDFTILGLYGGVPLVNDTDGRELIVDPHKQLLKVKTITGEIEFEYGFEDLSGDWCFSTFSQDGLYILLGMPYDFHIFKQKQ